MFNWFKKKKNNKGFTLVELVIVIAILAILVGLLAPQYTKYVEKSRKAADASNMDEMVKVLKIYAADPANELPVGGYKITISNTDAATAVTPVAYDGSTPNDAAIKKASDAIAAAIPSWNTTKTKSKKWKDGKTSCIEATVNVSQDGGTSVIYGPSDTDFDYYMKNGTESTD